MRITRENENTSNGLHPLSNQLSIFCLLAYNAIKDKQNKNFFLQYKIIIILNIIMMLMIEIFACLTCTMKLENTLFEYSSNIFLLITWKKRLMRMNFIHKSCPIVINFLCASILHFSFLAPLSFKICCIHFML